MTHSRPSDRGVPPLNTVPTNGNYLFAPICVWFSEGLANGKEGYQNRIQMIFSDAAISMKSGLLEAFQHMVVRCLRAELRGELLSF